MTKKKEPSTPRWKCPDCSAWIRDDVAEHTCAKSSLSPYYPWLQTGWTCGRCGTWVFGNQVHNCHYWGTGVYTTKITYTNDTAGQGYGTYTTGHAA